MYTPSRASASRWLLALGTALAMASPPAATTAVLADTPKGPPSVPKGVTIRTTTAISSAPPATPTAVPPPGIKIPLGVPRGTTDVAAQAIQALKVGVTSVWQPLNEHLEVFAVDSGGTLKDVWKAHDGPWQPAFSVTGPGFATAGTQLAAVWQPLDEHLEVFAVDDSGTLKDAWKQHDGAWAAPISLTTPTSQHRVVAEREGQAPVSLTGPNIVPSGAPVAAVWQPLDEHLEVFMVDADGAVQDIWKQHDGAWQPPLAITGPGFAPPGAHLAAVWQPLDEHLEVFAVDSTGAVKDVWKAHDGAWAPPITLTGPSFAAPGAPLSAVWQPLDEHLEVFGLDPNSGALNDAWKAHDGAWATASSVAGPGFAPPGATPSAVWQPLDEHLEVFAVNAQGAVNDAWKAHDGAWQTTFNLGNGDERVSNPIVGLGGVPLSAVWQPLDAHLEVFAVDTNATVQDVWKTNDGTGAYNFDGYLIGSGNTQGWENAFALTRANFQPKVFVDPRAPLCASFFRMWRNGYEDDKLMTMCSNFMGINAYCNSQDASVAVGNPPQDEDHRYLLCAPKSHPLTVGEEFDRLGTGIGQGLVAALPYISDGVQGVTCLYGGIFACATLAVDVAAQTDVANIDPAAIDFAKDAASCVNDDVVACVQLGTRGATMAASAAGVTIPGADAPGAARDCLNQDFLGCLQLGQMAAEAAGLPADQAQKATSLADECSNGDVGSCVQLGQQAAKIANLPTGGLPQNAASNVQPCSQGDVVACTQLGQAISTTVQ